MSFFIPYKCPPNDLLAEQLDFSADSILAKYRSNYNNEYAKLSTWSLERFQINVVPQFELISETVKVPDDIEVEPLTKEEVIQAADALDKGNFNIGIYSILDRVPGLEYQKISKKLIGVEVSLPGSVNEQQEFINLFYPHDPEIKLTNKELETALSRFNSDDARIIAHYSGLLLRRLHINDNANYNKEVDNWLLKIMQAKDLYDTLRIINVWASEYNLLFNHKDLKNFKSFFSKYSKLVVNISDDDFSTEKIKKSELEKYQSQTYKRLSSIISPPLDEIKIKTIKPNQYNYRYCSDNKGAYYIWRHTLPWYSKLWIWLKNWF